MQSPFILGLDTTTKKLTVGLSKGQALLESSILDSGEPHSITLLTEIQKLLESTNTSIENLHCLAVVTGPGSFTGIRMAIATAQGLGLTKNLPAIPLHSLELLALNFPGSEKPIRPVIPASSGDVYTALYSFKDKSLIEIESPQVVDWDTLYASINEPSTFTGWGSHKFSDNLSDYCGDMFILCPPEKAWIQPEVMMNLAWKKWQEKKTIPIADLKPNYIRKTQAELRLEEKEQK